MSCYNEDNMGEKYNDHSEYQDAPRCADCQRKLGRAAMKSTTVASGKERPVMPSREMSQVRSSETSGGPRAVMSPSTRKVIRIPMKSEFEQKEQ